MYLDYTIFNIIQKEVYLQNELGLNLIKLINSFTTGPAKSSMLSRLEKTVISNEKRKYQNWTTKNIIKLLYPRWLTQEIKSIPSMFSLLNINITQFNHDRVKLASTCAWPHPSVSNSGRCCPPLTPTVNTPTYRQNKPKLNTCTFHTLT